MKYVEIKFGINLSPQKLFLVENYIKSWIPKNYLCGQVLEISVIRNL